jgi:hypothetical protein
MDPKTVAIKGFKGLYGRVGTLGNGLFGWYDIVFDGPSSSDPKYQWTMTKPDSLFSFRPNSGEPGCLGLDATQYSTDVCKQFYLKPDSAGGRGPYESPVVYEGTLVGELLGVVEYNDGKYPSCAFSVELL